MILFFNSLSVQSNNYENKGNRIIGDYKPSSLNHST